MILSDSISGAGKLARAERLLFLVLNFNREEERIHENGFWELQAYTNLRGGTMCQGGIRNSSLTQRASERR